MVIYRSTGYRPILGDVGQLGVVMRAAGAIAIVCASAATGRAGTVTFDNGVTSAGLARVTPDDYGTYGFLIGQQYDDEFHPIGATNPFTPTYLTGVELYLTTANNATSSLLLTDYKFWADFVENPPPQPDGILADAMHVALARSVTTPIAMTGTNEATSAFRVATDTQSGVRIDVGLVQRLSSDPATPSATLDQIYTLTNNGTAQVSLVFHLAWDPDLYFNGDQKDSDDVVGAAPGLCGVYQHDQDIRWVVGLGSGPMSTVPLTYYFGGKEGFVPGAGPAFAPISALIDEQHIWINKGIPTEWRNYVVGPGRSAVGESDPLLDGDATIGLEWRFSLAPNATETIHVRRYYGTPNVECFVSANCGNGIMDSGEACDGADTPTCNGATCTPSACGDGHMNVAAGEACDSSGVDSADCNGATCSVPACGDGHVNEAAGEECEDGELCESCAYNFTVGGGCSGCASNRATEAPWWLLLIVLLRRRRR
jgi:hypothetical protein